MVGNLEIRKKSLIIILDCHLIKLCWQDPPILSTTIPHVLQLFFTPFLLRGCSRPLATQILFLMFTQAQKQKNTHRMLFCRGCIIKSATCVWSAIVSNWIRSSMSNKSQFISKSRSLIEAASSNLTSMRSGQHRYVANLIVREKGAHRAAITRQLVPASMPHFPDRTLYASPPPRSFVKFFLRQIMKIVSVCLAACLAISTRRVCTMSVQSECRTQKIVCWTVVFSIEKTERIEKMAFKINSILCENSKRNIVP